VVLEQKTAGSLKGERSLRCDPDQWRGVMRGASRGSHGNGSAGEVMVQAVRWDPRRCEGQRVEAVVDVADSDLVLGMVPGADTAERDGASREGGDGVKQETRIERDAGWAGLAARGEGEGDHCTEG
jgi:hypothetical protein